MSHDVILCHVKKFIIVKLSQRLKRSVRISHERARYIVMNEKEIKCWTCGKRATITKGRYSKELLEYGARVMSTEPNRHYRCYCQECFDKKTSEYEADKKAYKILQKKMMFESAIENLERQDLLLWNYKDAIDTVEQYNLENLDKFDSSYEIIAAIILIHNKIQTKVHYKIAGAEVDFLLTDLCVALEIDGYQHKHRKDKDEVRDYFVKRELGQDWEVIRIKTDYLDKHADRLVSAINRTISARERNQY